MRRHDCPRRDVAEDAGERADSEGFLSRNREVVALRGVRNEPDMAPALPRGPDCRGTRQTVKEVLYDND